MSVNDSKPIARRALGAMGIAGALIALAISGCGSYSKSPQTATGSSPVAHGYGAPAKPSDAAPERKPVTPTTESKAPASAAVSGGIPQNNGGDQDADNNGAPSDGDGDV